MKVKGVAFNTDNIDEDKLLKHASKRTNFSAYIKRLIQRDMDGIIFNSNFTNQNLHMIEETEQPQIDDNLMDSLI